MTLVVDASVVAKWLFEEADSGKARRFLEEARDGGVRLIAPEIIGAEIANVLWKKVRRGELRPAEAMGHYERFRKVSPAPVAISLLAGGALKLALKHSHPVYDCLYVALALEARCVLITADARLYSAIGPDAGIVRLLKDWQA